MTVVFIKTGLDGTVDFYNKFLPTLAEDVIYTRCSQAQAILSPSLGN
jgi:hypothetical protein